MTAHSATASMPDVPDDDLLHMYRVYGAGTELDGFARALLERVTDSRLNETGGGSGEELATAYLWGLILSDPGTVTT